MVIYAEKKKVCVLPCHIYMPCSKRLPDCVKCSALYLTVESFLPGVTLLVTMTELCIMSDTVLIRLNDGIIASANSQRFDGVKIKYQRFA